jgi:hypothetical protein
MPHEDTDFRDTLLAFFERTLRDENRIIKKEIQSLFKKKEGREFLYANHQKLFM